MKMYEMMVIFDASKYNADPTGTVQSIHQMIEKHKGHIEVSRTWDERKFTYQINNQKKGVYYLFYFTAPGPEAKLMEQDLRLNETVVRYLTLVVHPKLVDEMLNIAKSEDHAVAKRAPGLVEEDYSPGGN